MNGNTELLNFIYQNSQMGVNTLQQLLELNEAHQLTQQLKMQLGEYREINGEAREMLHKNGCDEKGLSGYEKIKTYLMVNMQTMTDRSPSHIAEMLIVGSTMGIIDGVRHLNQYKEAEADIQRLMKRLMAFEEQNVEQLKGYL